jgi:hypothetical protein
MIERGETGALRPLLAVLMAVLFALLIVGCSSKDDSDLNADDAAEAGEGEPLPPTKASVEITYHRKGDTLTRAVVTKYFGAEVIENKQRDARHSETIVRFNGGVPVWEFKADRGLINEVSTLGASSKYIPKRIEYGKLPSRFEQVIPDDGPPEPLDRGAFYVFEVERASGSTSYQAVKVEADGSLQAFNAVPRAGSSYLLCCNVPSDFSEPVILPDTGTETDHQTGEGDDQSPDNAPDNSQPQ